VGLLLNAKHHNCDLIPRKNSNKVFRVRCVKKQTRVADLRSHKRIEFATSFDFENVVDFDSRLRAARVNQLLQMCEFVEISVERQIRVVSERSDFAAESAVSSGGICERQPVSRLAEQKNVAQQFAQIVFLREPLLRSCSCALRFARRFRVWNTSVLEMQPRNNY